MVARAPVTVSSLRLPLVKQIGGHEGLTSRLPAVVQLFNRVGGFLAMQ